MTLRPLFRSAFFLCFVLFFAVVDSSQSAAIVPGFVVDSSRFSLRLASLFERGGVISSALQVVFHICF